MNYSLYKSLVLTLLTGCFFTTNLIAQVCTPDTNYTTPGIYPDSLAFGYADQSYTSVINFRIPTDTIITINVDIDSIELLNVVGMPAGFTYGCNIATCIWAGGTNGCTEINGAPDSAMYGIHPIQLMTRTYGRIFDSIPLIQLDTVIFKLFICTADSTCPIDTNSFIFFTKPVLEFELGQSYPNPVSLISNIPYVTRKRQEVNLKVYDVWGREVFSKTETSQAGRNIIKFSTTLLSTGLYYYNLSDGKTVLTRKMTVIRF